MASSEQDPTRVNEVDDTRNDGELREDAIERVSGGVENGFYDPPDSDYKDGGCTPIRPLSF